MPEKLVTFREIPRNSRHDTSLLSRGKPLFSFPHAVVIDSREIPVPAAAIRQYTLLSPANFVALPRRLHSRLLYWPPESAYRLPCGKWEHPSAQ